MAMMDYGVIAKKNGKIINTGFFTDMKDTLGFECEKDNNGNLIKGECFIFLGDEDFYIGIYKTHISIYKNKNEFIDEILDLDYYVATSKETKFRYKKVIDNVELDVRRFNSDSTYILRFWYKGDLYEAMYGYGVDLDINYLRHNLNRKDKVKLNKWLNNCERKVRK